MPSIFYNFITQSGGHHSIKLYEPSLGLLIETINYCFAHLVLHLQWQVLLYVAFQRYLLV